jgi:hypothetical protein
MFRSVSRFPSARRATLAAFLTAAVLSLVVAAPISAAALIIRDTVTTPIFETGIVDDCGTGITGTIVGTDVADVLIVDFPPDGYHISVTDTGTGQITWSDGTYTLIESIDHISFITAKNGTVVFTSAHEDSGNTYTATGEFLSRTTFHLVEKFTATDGVVRVNFERGHFHFFDGC